MLERYLEMKSLNFVVLGDLNPIIIQPLWLSSKGLIRESEAQAAKIEIIHNEIVKFQIEDWATVEITKERFSISTSNEAFFITVRDLVISIFKLLKETPIKALGINHHLHFAIPTEEKYYEIGNKLAPLANWTDILKNPRLATLEIMDVERKDNLPGSVRIFVQPSDQFQALSTKYGLMIKVNDHFTLTEFGKNTNVEFIKRMTDNWDTSLEQVDSIIKRLSKIFF